MQGNRLALFILNFPVFHEGYTHKILFEGILRHGRVVETFLHFGLSYKARLYVFCH